MVISQDDNICIITQEKASVKTLANNISQVYDKYKSYHIVVNLMDLEKLSLEDVLAFLQLSNTHRADKKSFVLVSNTANLSEIPDEIVVVPTLHEAYDVIEMEDIERDLGF